MSTALFQQIETLLPSLHGWCHLEKAHILAAAVLALQPEVVVEVGVWGGRSLFPMALAMKTYGKGLVTGIDPWAPQESVQGQGEQDAKWWGEIDHEVVFKSFMDKIKELGLDSFISVLRQKSDDVTPPPCIDIFHLDGNHGPQATIDAKRFAPKVRVGGLCCLDDLHWSGGGVERAEDFLKTIGFVKLYDLGTGAMYQRQGVW